MSFFVRNTKFGEEIRGVRLFGVLALAVLVLLSVIMAVNIVKEGHVGVVKRFGKAQRQVGPGLQIVVPFIEGIERIDVRQRKNLEELAAATADQLAITAVVSINWTVDKEAAMDLFIRYGGLSQFESRILDPKLRSAAKASISRFPAAELIRRRLDAVREIMDTMTKEMEGFPVVINSPQLENIALPEAYKQSVLEKERERENAEKEKYALLRQKQVSLQAVNTAEAEAKAKRIQADAQAYRVITEAKAEADAIKLINEQLSISPNYIKLVRAKRWDGKVPRTVLGDDADILMSIK